MFLIIATVIASIYLFGQYYTYSLKVRDIGEVLGICKNNMKTRELNDIEYQYYSIKCKQLEKEYYSEKRIASVFGWATVLLPVCMTMLLFAIYNKVDDA